MDQSDVVAVLTLGGIVLIPVIVGIFSRSAWQSVLWAFVLVLIAFVANSYLLPASDFPLPKVPNDLAPVVVLLMLLDLGGKAIGVAVLTLLGYGIKRLFVRKRSATQVS
jgi:hypothetical protein